MNYRLHLSLVILFFSGILSLNAQTQEGMASFYADKFEGRTTANGEKYRHKELTAAHKTLPFDTKVKVTNLKNNKTVIVRINDRGPYVEGRIIDLSKSAAEELGFVIDGLAKVKIEIVDAGDGKTSSVITKPIDNVRVEEDEFYNFDVARSKPKGFGIQIGSYRELVNLVHFSENLKSSYRKEVTVQVKVINGVKVYTVIVGEFPTREKANQFKAEVQNKYPDAFIVEFEKM